MKHCTPLTTLAALALAAWGCAAQAGTVSLGMDRSSPLTAGDTVTFTVADSRARDMFDATLGFGGGDFRFLYDTAALEFVAVAYPAWITSAASVFVADNAAAPPLGEVLVTLTGLDEQAFPADPDTLFAVSFLVRPAAGGSVQVAAPDVPSYVFAAPDPLRFAIAGAVPVPSTLALLVPALLGAAMARRPLRYAAPPA